MFFRSQSEHEKNHIVDAFRFELGKVEAPAIRERVVGMLTQVNETLASKVAQGLGIPVPKVAELLNQNIPADGDPEAFQPKLVTQSLKSSKALSMSATVKDSVKTTQIAVLAADGVDEESLNEMKVTLESAGAKVKIIAPHLGKITSSDGKTIKVDQSFLIAASVLFDAVFVPDGSQSAAMLKTIPQAITFINEANLHCKPIAANGAGIDFLKITEAGSGIDDKRQTNSTMGVLTNSTAKEFVYAISQHRFWEREKPVKV